MELTQKWFWGLVGSFILVYIIGWNIHVMEIDAAQYAALSMEMLQSGDFFQVHLRGENYLDKPPLTFWLSATSFALFGLNDMAYRLPHFLMALLALFSTYSLAKIYYSTSVAQWSVLVLGGCQAFFLMNHDCRTDTILTGAVAFTLWQMGAYISNGRWIHILGSGFGMGLALLTKGPMGLVIPILTYGPHLVLNVRFKTIFDPKWIVALFIAGIMLLPMCWGLYQQYGMYGLRFYFWIQSFGRITGESTWDNGTGPLFLWQNHLWSFAPFTFVFFFAMFFQAKTIFNHLFKKQPCPEMFSFFGFLLPFLAFSSSHYQLPHYIFVLYPMASIFTANYIVHEYPKAKNLILNGLHIVLVGIFLALILFLVLYSLEGITYKSIGYVLFGIIILVFLYVKRPATSSLLWYTTALYAYINVGLNGIAYPSLLQYQFGSICGVWAREHQIPVEKFKCYRAEGGFGLDFYLNGIPEKIQDTEHKIPFERDFKGYTVFTDADGIGNIQRAGFQVDTILKGEEYHVSTLTPKFINPATRNETVEKKYLIHVR